MAGYRNVNIAEGKTTFIAGEELKFRISNEEAAGFVIQTTNKAVLVFVVEHSYDGGASWATAASAPITTSPAGDAAHYTPAVGVFGALGRIRVTTGGTADAIWRLERP